MNQPDWDENELSEIGSNLRENIEANIAKKVQITCRILSIDRRIHETVRAQEDIEEGTETEDCSIDLKDLGYLPKDIT